MKNLNKNRYSSQIEKYLNNSYIEKRMEEIDILKGLFDEKILDVINLFAKHPEKQFYLSEISKMSNVNVSSTFRIVQKLIDNEVIKSTTIGKVKIYQFGSGERARALWNLLKKSSEKDPLYVYIDKIKAEPKLKKIILDSKEVRGAKLILIAETIPIPNTEKPIEEVKKQFNYTIQIVCMSSSQYESLKLFKNFDLGKKLIWERK